MAAVLQSRRRFIATLIGAIAGGWFLQRFFAVPLRRNRLILEVPAENMPERGALVFRAQRVALVRESGQIQALSLVCTHLGCTVNVQPEGMVCPCHGSVFSSTGAVIKGPATENLTPLHLERRDDMLYVYQKA